MFIIHGRKTALIKAYHDHQHPCKNCGVFDLKVEVYRQYYHLFFIPLMPYGTKTVHVKCRSCGYPNNLEIIRDQYERETKTPFYLYTIPILTAVLISAILYFNNQAQKKKAAYVTNPKIGDVYLIRKDEKNSTNYYFLKVAAMKGDTITAYHNNLLYQGFTMSFDVGDFFVAADQLFFTKSALKQMLDRDEINAVQRDYGGETGFDRVK